jgi:hypothetical protein
MIQVVLSRESNPVLDNASNASVENAPVLGNFTVYMPGEEESILSMAKFRGMIKSIQCTDTTMDIAFIDEMSYNYAKTNWDWVNGADNHSFLMVAGTGDCGWNPARLPFVVSTIDYDDPLNTAHLSVNASEWKQVAHTYDLHVGGMPQPVQMRKRFGAVDYAKDVNIDFNHKLPNPSITFPDPEITVTVGCPNCGTSGTFDISFSLHTEFFVPRGASVSLKAQGVSVFLNPKLTLSANLTGTKNLKYSFPDIPIEAIEIPDVLTIGPVISTQVGVSLGPVKGVADITSGVTVKIPDTAQVSVDLVGASFQHTDWTPSITTAPVTLDAKLEADVKVYADVAVAIKAEALGEGYEAKLKLEPYLQGTLQAIVTNAATGACPKDPLHQPFGIGFFPSYGMSLIAEIDDVNNDQTPIASITIFVCAGKCFNIFQEVYH